MRCVAYVDGSFSEAVDCATNEVVGVYGSGMYLILEGQDMPLELQASGAESNLASLRNVAGEMMACCQIITFLQENYPQYTEIDIYYDYEGIEKWVTGEWRARKPETQAYREIMRDAQKTMKLKFHKVLAHSGVIYNERADMLAKDAVLKRIISMGLVAK